MENKKELTEQEIRSRYISPAIQNAGWTFTQIRENYAITKGRIIARGGSPKRENPKFADYVLFYKSHIPIAIIEAKDNKHAVSDGMQQALGYAESLQVPFVFTSNGDGFTFHNRTETNSDNNDKGDKEAFLSLEQFPSPQELWEAYITNKEFTKEQEAIITEPYYVQREDKSPRYYQLNAINSTVEAIAKGQNRILLIMATGTGKTYTAFQIIWRLWKAGIKKRILFLADRNALIDQTYSNDFSPFKDKMTIIRHRKVDKAYEIYLALYQGLTGEGEKEVFKQFSPNFFDLIVIDECHRGSAKEDSEWREILEYFSSATHIGLTATPKETKDTSNIHYFGEPVYTYSLKQGIEDGFLAPYRVIRTIMDKDIDGFRPYDGQVDKYNNLIEDKIYTTSDFNRTLILEHRTRLVARVVSNYLKKHNLRFAKTIFFCVDTEHADSMRQALINENKDLFNENSHYVMRITGDDLEGKKQLDAFRDVNSTYPVLVTTSKLLTTGVDAQMVKFIVLDANISSMTEFKQIIGRGTRVREDLGKMFFTIFDFRGVTRLFADPEFDGPVEQDDDFIIDEDGNIDEQNNENGNDENSNNENGNDENDRTDPISDINDPIDDGKDCDGVRKYYVNNVYVRVVSSQIRYMDKDGKLINESLTDYTRKNVLNQFSTLEDFLAEWNKAESKQAVIDELAKHGLLIDELQEEIGEEFDPFDLICHIAFDKKPLTRKERANNVKKRNYFAKYEKQAQEVLHALLEKYADMGIESLESSEILKLDPLSSFGNPMYIVNRIFKGKTDFEKAIKELEKVLYVA